MGARLPLCVLWLSFVAYAAKWDDNAHRVGICQQGGSSTPKSKYLLSVDLSFGWDEVQPKIDEWDFSKLEKNIDDMLKEHPGLSLVAKPTTGDEAPTWLYKSPVNVPEIYTTSSSRPGPFPYYLDATYQQYFLAFQKKVYEWIVGSKYFPDNVFVTQAMFGSTGDDTPWHGDPTNKKYDISSEQWWEFEKNMTHYVCGYYYHSKPDTSPQLLQLYNFGSNASRNNWLNEHCPGTYRKNGQASHGYQLNEEYNDYMDVGILSRNAVQNNISIRFRGETNSGPGQAGGWFTQAPYWNMFTLLQWHLTYGIDFPGFNSDQFDGTYDVQYAFFDLHAKYKHADGGPNGDTPMAAFIGLRDGLDSNDTERFSEKDYGTASEKNSERMVKIAQAMAEYGAEQQDPDAATGGPMNQRAAKKMNDVGFGIWRDNYGKFISQIDPMGTSQGRWRVGSMTDKEQIYGRFARSFDHKAGKDTMCFVLDEHLFGGLPLSKNMDLLFNVTYFDEGDGGWSFGYDARGEHNKLVKMVKKTNKKEWIVEHIAVGDAYFGQRGTMKSDFCLYSNDTKDDTIFSFIQVAAYDE